MQVKNGFFTCRSRCKDLVTISLDIKQINKSFFNQSYEIINFQEYLTTVFDVLFVCNFILEAKDDSYDNKIGEDWFSVNCHQLIHLCLNCNTVG